MTRRLVATYVVLAAILLAVLEVPLAVVQATSQRERLQQRLERDAVALAALAEDDLQRADQAARQRIQLTVSRYAASTAVRVVVIDRNGALLADSSPDAELGRDFASRPEISSALAGRVATGDRRSETLGTRLLYVAVPVASGGRVYGAVRATYPTSNIDAHVRRYRLVLLGIALGALAATALIGWWIARWVSQPLLSLHGSVRRVGGGDLAERADPHLGPPEVRELALGFNDMVARLEQTVLSQEAFVADASHQLRSPLTALRLRIENLQAALPEADAVEAEATLAEVDRLNRLVDGLLALARADRKATRRSPQAVGAIVRERVTAWEAAAEEEGIALVSEVLDDHRVRLAEGALEQVLDNLVANAIEASPAGSEIRIVVQADADLTQIQVADRGPGLAPELREHAFDRFWSERGGNTGSGLGLAIVRRLVEADGGTVRLDEHQGGGLTAVVRYPNA
ncbi:MAG: HAMP domain-containing protein [Myxococcales bacterium]|nr:HAMP domain-containing protein [Myxococcales bacterium]